MDKAMLYEYQCTVIRVIDGDTVDVAIDLGLRIYHQTRIRLYGINAPEMSTDEGKRAKARLSELMPVGGEFILRTIKDRKEKYGRYLGIFVDSEGHEVSQRMVSEGLATVHLP
jgi:micrococcal nuclease